MRELLSTLIALVILIITSLAGALKASAKNDSDKDARIEAKVWFKDGRIYDCLLYTSPSPRDTR